MENQAHTSETCRHVSDQGALELLATASGTHSTPLIQYPIDDTFPVKMWVFEQHPAAQGPFTPLRPEDERKAIEAINRHLPPSERINVDQYLRASIQANLRLTPGLYPGTQLLLPPPSWDVPDRQEVATPSDSSKAAESAEIAGEETPRLARNLNWTETENSDQEDAWRAEMERDGPIVIVPDIIVTRPDGATRRLQDPNRYLY